MEYRHQLVMRRASHFILVGHHEGCDYEKKRERGKKKKRKKERGEE